MNVSARAALSFSAISLLLLFVGCFSLVQVQALRETEQVMETNWLAGVRDSGGLRSDLLELRLMVARSLIPSADESAADARRDIGERRSQIEQRVSSYLASPLIDEQERRLVGQVQTAVHGYEQSLEQCSRFFRVAMRPRRSRCSTAACASRAAISTRHWRP